MKRVAAAVAAGKLEHARKDGAPDPARIVVEGHELSEVEGDFSQRLVPLGDQSSHQVGVTATGLVVQLDVRTTPELEREGLARDVVRLIQQARKEAGLHVSDHIDLAVEASAPVRAALEAHAGYVREQVLAEGLDTRGARGHAFVQEAELGGEPLLVGLTRKG
jgi:isoleucyl-tRNA synthetase